MNPQDPEIKVVLYSNRAQCHLNLKSYVDAEKDALSALRIDHLHIKSLFRHGTALYYLKRYKEAKREFNNLLRIEPSNKNGFEYLRHTDQKLSKIKTEAYEKLYYGEIVGDTTSKGVSVIRVEEINLDPKLRQQMEEQKEKVANKDLVKEIEVKEKLEDSKHDGVRESKTEFLTKTDVSNIARNKGEQKNLDEFVENKEELEELKKLEEERKNDGNKRKKRKDRKKKNKNNNQNHIAFVDNNIEDHPTGTQEEDKNNLSISLNGDDKKEEKLETSEIPKVQNKVDEKPKISFNLAEDDEGEELESPTDGDGTPETFGTHASQTMKEMKKNVQSELKLTKKISIPSLFFGDDIVSFEHAHEVHQDKDKPVERDRIKSE